MEETYVGGNSLGLFSLALLLARFKQHTQNLEMITTQTAIAIKIKAIFKIVKMLIFAKKVSTSEISIKKNEKCSCPTLAAFS
jgi:hypothetical protein